MTEFEKLIAEANDLLESKKDLSAEVLKLQGELVESRRQNTEISGAIWIYADGAIRIGKRFVFKDRRFFTTEFRQHDMTVPAYRIEWFMLGRTPNGKFDIYTEV